MMLLMSILALLLLLLLLLHGMHCTGLGEQGIQLRLFTYMHGRKGACREAAHTVACINNKMVLMTADGCVNACEHVHSTSNQQVQD